MDIYGFDATEGFISNVTDKILPQIEEWQNRPLEDVYPVVFIDAIHYSVRDNGVIRKLAAYVIFGISSEGMKEVLTIQVGENESTKYWLSVLNELKNRGVKDILILCADGLSGIKEVIAAAFPNTEYQRYLVYQVRNTLKYVSEKDKKSFAADLKKYTMPQQNLVVVKFLMMLQKNRRYMENWQLCMKEDWNSFKTMHVKNIACKHRCILTCRHS
jgi:transposase-like protein